MRALLAVFVLGLAFAPPSRGQETTPVAPPAESSRPPEANTQPPSRATRAGVTPPTVLTHVEPEYSEKARKKKISGNCLVALTVGQDGIPANVHVVRSISENRPPKLREAALSLDAKAIEAVQQYRFRPAMREGQPVATQLRIEVNFQVF